MLPNNYTTMIAYIVFWSFFAALGALAGLHISGKISDTAYVVILAITALALLVWSARGKKAEH